MEERTEVGVDGTPDVATPPPVASDGSTDVATLIWTVAVAVAVLLAVTATVTSFVMWTDYQPDAATVGCTVDAQSACITGDGAASASDWRQAAAASAALLSLVLAACGIVKAIRTRSERAVGAAVAALAAAALAVITGALGTTLQWDQLALRAVQVVPPDHFRGLGWAFDARADSVRFVLVAGAEVGVDTIRRWIVLTMGSAIGAFSLLAISLFLLRPTPAHPAVPNPNP